MSREQELVERFADRTQVVSALDAIYGSRKGREARGMKLAPGLVDALVSGVHHPHPRGRNAAHALGCVICKPAWDGSLPPGALDRIAELAESDPNARVRLAARRSLACRAAAAEPA